MKKLQTLGIAGLIALAITSCKKDRECECTIKDDFGSTTVVTTLKSTTKKQAKDACVSKTLYDETGQIYEEWNCKLK
jgi:hypothetical protein